MSKNFSNATLYQNRYELSADADEQFELTASEPFTPEFMIAQPGNRKMSPWKREVVSRDEAAEALKGVGKLVRLEWNFYKHAPRPKDGDSAALNFKAAAFFRHMVAAPKETRRLRRLINAGYTGKGFNSPYTSQEFLWKAIDTFGGPESADRQLRGTIGRANTILEPYGLRVSNKALGTSLENKSRSHKAGKRAAALTLQEVLESAFGVRVSAKEALFVGQGFAAAIKLPKPIRRWIGNRIQAGEFKTLRQALEASTRLVRETTDRVEVYLDPITAIRRGPATAYLASPVRDKHMMCVVKMADRSYHTGMYWVWEGNTERIDSRQPFREAFAAWREQNEAVRLAQEDAGIPDNVSLLVWKSDSYAVGNCDPGTRAFMRQIGVNPDRKFAGAHLVLPHMYQEWRARTTLIYAARQLRNQLEQQELRLAS